METKRFQKKKEDFVCEMCGFRMEGTGYTNHCSNCLWSKHVDIYPGDRGEMCQGKMQPIGVEEKSGEYILIHRCTKCGALRNIIASPEDNIERIVELSANPLN